MTEPLPASADSIRSQEWYLNSLNVEQAHAITKGKGVKVAVIDTEVDPNHQDLIGNAIAGGGANASNSEGTLDFDGHGTAMASFLDAPAFLKSTQ